MQLYKRTRIKLKELKPRKKIEWTDKQRAMTNDVISFYDTDKGIITVSKYNEILDGNHRYLILINHFGGEHEIEVRQKPFAKWIYLIQSFTVMLVLLPVLLPYAIIKQLIKTIRHGRIST